MNLSFRIDDGVAFVRVHSPRIDAAVAIQFKDRFSELACQTSGGAPAIVVLDLEEVDFLDSSGLGAVVAARKLLGSERTLALAALRPGVGKVIRLTHMDRVFPIFHDTAAVHRAPPTAGIG